MARWKEGIEKIVSFTAKPDTSLEEFFKPKNYLPQNEEEKQIFEEFSLVTSSMAILIHVARADRVLKAEEKEQIINDMMFQLEQRPYEYSKLSEKFGSYEKEIILNLFNKILDDYQTGKLDLDKIVDVICLIYQNNPEKRYYLIRLCYYCALADYDFDVAEKETIYSLAKKMNIPDNELERIEREVKKEVMEK